MVKTQIPFISIVLMIVDFTKYPAESRDRLVKACILYAKQKHLGCKKMCEAKKNQRLKTLISNKAKKSLNESAT